MKRRFFVVCRSEPLSASAVAGLADPEAYIHSPRVRDLFLHVLEEISS